MVGASDATDCDVNLFGLCMDSTNQTQESSLLGWHDLGRTSARLHVLGQTSSNIVSARAIVFKCKMSMIDALSLSLCMCRVVRVCMYTLILN